MTRKFALLIGVSEYGDGFEPLSAPPNDVAALKRVLENPDLGGFEPANIKTLINPDPIAMQRHILELFSQSTKEDLVVLFFSGHGITNDDNHLYFCTRQTSKADYLATGVPARFIQALANNHNYAKRQVLILDCCYSGAFGEGWNLKGNAKVEIEQELGKEGRVVLTSSSATQVSFQQEDADLSLYTQYLVEGIETGAADADQDGVIKVRELHSYAKRKVQEVKPKLKPDIIVADDEGYDIHVSKVKVDAESQFRRGVEQYIDHSRGEIRSRCSQEILDKRARDLGIAPEQSQVIIASVLEPTRRRLNSLERYRQEYEAEVEKQYPLSDVMLADLQEWQQEVLGLEDSDVVKIQNEINLAKERQRAAIQEQQERQRAQEERERQESERQRAEAEQQRLEEEKLQRQELEQQQLEQEKATYAENLRRYEQEFTGAIDTEYPLPQYMIDGLRHYQLQLGIRDEDIAVLEKPLRDRSEAKFQEQLRQQEEAERQRLTKTQPVPSPSESSPPPPQVEPPQPNKDKNLVTFQFQTATIAGIRTTGGLLGFGGQTIVDTRRSDKTTQGFIETLKKGITLEMVHIPSGSFWMGQNEAEKQEIIRQLGEKKYKEYFVSELPRHQVWVSSFSMGKFPVTQAQYEVVMGNNPATKYNEKFVAPNKPVVGVMWEDAIAYCNKLSELKGQEYRLPSESEWEYACRAGTEAPFYFGETITTDLANYRGIDHEWGFGSYGEGPKGIFREETTPVGSFSANAFCLFDMHGNVWEWCQDVFHSSYEEAPTDGSAWEVDGVSDYRIIRGGSWDYSPLNCRSAHRIRFSPGYRNNSLGFRVVSVSAQDS